MFAAFATIAATVCLVSLAILTTSALETRRLAQAQQRAVTVAREVTGLLALTQEDLLHHEPRSARQWQAGYRALRQAVSPPTTESAPEVGPAFLQDELDALPVLFDTLRSAAEPPVATSFAMRRRDLLMDELLTASQAIADIAYERERRLTGRRNASERRLMALAVAVPATLSLLLMGGGILLGRRVLAPIAHLQRSMARMAEGDLAARDANPSLDEVGDLSRGFDRMATELEQREAALRASESMLRNVTDNLPAMVGYWDRALCNRFANADYRRWFGKAPEQVMGRSIHELLGPELFEKNRPYVEAVLAGQRQDFPRTIVGPDGVTRYSQASYIPDVQGGQVEGFFVLVTDVTDRVKAEQALQRALAEKETLLKEVYHRVKNNLQVVQSLLSLQARGVGNETVRVAFAEMGQRVRAMALVHEQLYRAADLSAVVLQDYVRDLLHQMAAAHATDHEAVAISQQVDPIEVGVDVAIPLGLLITELVGNSFKHGFPSGGPGRIDVHIVREGQGFRVSVVDDGVGLPEQLDPARTRSIGLQLAQALAGQLGGELHFGPRPGAHIWLVVADGGKTAFGRHS